MNYKPFDLEEAKEGKKVITRDGLEARIIYWDMKGDYPIIAIIKRDDGSEVERSYSKEGKYLVDSADNFNDLVMDATECDCYINLYVNDEGVRYAHGDTWYSEEEAKENIDKSLNYLSTARVAWYE